MSTVGKNDPTEPLPRPRTGTPGHGGLTFRQALDLLRIMFVSVPIKAMDLVEVSSPLDISDMNLAGGLEDSA